MRTPETPLLVCYGWGKKDGILETEGYENQVFVRVIVEVDYSSAAAALKGAFQEAQWTGRSQHRTHKDHWSSVGTLVLISLEMLTSPSDSRRTVNS